ncbi:MAG: hypothetical protein K0B02_04905 [DPANN group archaeon]|nr:hypothetical protein [DPANN group archaeon]
MIQIQEILDVKGVILKRKGIEQSIWLIMVAIISLIMVLILMTLFSSSMEKTGVESQKSINSTGISIKCTIACKQCCVSRIEPDCKDFVNNNYLGCTCVDSDTSEVGC